MFTPFVRVELKGISIISHSLLLMNLDHYQTA